MTRAGEIDDRPARARWPGRALIALALLALVLGGIWSARKPILRGYLDRRLRAARVPARYTVAELGFGRQRLTDVVIGDPARPDLVADWVEVTTALGATGAQVRAVRAGSVRAHGVWRDGRLSLGALDRLLPAAAGARGGPVLPALAIDIADARMRVETPWGVLGVATHGRGRLDDGFEGAVALTGTALAVNGCAVARPEAVLRVSTRGGAPRLRGPVRAAAARCSGQDGAGAPRATIDVTLTPAMDGWRGGAELAAASLAISGARATELRARMTGGGAAAGQAGHVNASAATLAGAGVAVHNLTLDGAGRWATARASFSGRVGVADARVPTGAMRALAAMRASAPGTPLAPILAQLGAALARAGQRFDGSAALAVAREGTATAVRVSEVALRADSGAGLRWTGVGAALRWPGGAIRIGGRVVLAGGGLPAVTATLDQPRASRPMAGTVTIAPMAAGTARLALTPVRYMLDLNGAFRARGSALLSGPLADGAVEGLSVPLDLDWRGGDLVVNPVCARFAAERVRAAGLDLTRTVLDACPLEGAMLRIARGRIGGGVALPGVRLAGTMGGMPLSVASGALQYRLGDGRLTAAQVSARLGGADAVSRIDLGTLTGRVVGGDAQGDFSAGAGQIARVPLLLRETAGRWQVTRGRLDLTGALTVSDADPTPRFRPLRARDVHVVMAGGRITASAGLRTPKEGVLVTNVAIRHDLAAGTGSADLDVPALTFTPEFQPDAVTPLTFGIIADVRATVTGAGHIAWSPTGITSGGDVGTHDAALAAAFGPVTGLSTDIRFTDLLTMASAPDQVATVRSINPGVEVVDGVVHYRLLPGERVEIDGARWPFAGGALSLDPTTLDFAQAVERRMTFQVQGADAAKFLLQFGFKDLDATGVFDGSLPMIFDATGGRIAAGRLTVRPGGGTLAYVGAVSQKDLGAWGNLAFGALKSLRYQRLGITMNGPLDGEMVTEVRFAGISQGVGARSNFLIRRLQRLPLVFNVRIRAPFRTLLGQAEDFWDPKRYIDRNLPLFLQQQEKATGAPPSIQPRSSPTVPPAKRD